MRLFMSAYETLLSGKPGDKLFLLGNEAIARGAIEAGVAVATTYPGTPSSEVGDILYEIGAEAGMKFEFSVNEKVAMESAFAASLAGLKSFVFMKHVGLNVASDVLMSISYTGIRGPMVIMSADDPSMFSSQNEQDNRYYAHFAHVPLIEPSNPQEAKDFLKVAFEISEMESLPVIFRTTTRISHMRGTVTLSPVSAPNLKGRFAKGGRSFVSLPSNSYDYKDELIDKMRRIGTHDFQGILNRSEGDRESRIGFISSGEAYNVLRDVLDKHQVNAEVLKLGITNPMPENIAREFLSRHGTIIVVEEVDPIIESDIRAIADVGFPEVTVLGKMDGTVPMSHETSPNTLEESLAGILDFNITDRKPYKQEQELPPRPPVLCAGCPHRATYFAVKRAVKMLKLDDPVYSTDIGCYSLGNYEPFSEADIMLEMGSSIGVGSGFTRATDQRVISFIGDSTFFHAGIPALVNAVNNNSRMLVVIMDNDVTAMTGRQPNPGTPVSQTAGRQKSQSIENIVRSLGVDSLKTVDPYDLKETLGAIMEGLKNEGVSVVIAKRECAILRDNRMRKEGHEVKYHVVPESCSSCFNCVENFACPALSISNGKVTIDPVLCDGCGVCSQPYVCPFKAIEVSNVEN